MAVDPLAGELKAYAMLTLPIVFMIIAWIAFLLRVYVRTKMINSFGADDWTMLVTVFLYSGFCIQVIRVAMVELTVNLEADPNAFSGLATTIITVFGLYIISTILFKISLAIFFLRVVNQRWQRWVIYASVGIYSTFGAAFLFVALFQCGNPAQYLAHEEAGECLPYDTVIGPMNYIHSTLNAVTDWTFAIVPIFVVRSTLMSRQARATVIAILCLGIIGSVCSVVRIAYVDLLGVGFNLDLLIKAPKFATLSIVELGVGISSVCFATLRPLFQRFLGGSRTGYTGNAYAYGNGTNQRNRTRNSARLATATEPDTELEEVKGGKEITVTTVIEHDFEAGRGEEARAENDAESEKDLL